MDTTRLTKVALIVGMLAALAVFYLVYRLLSVPSVQSGTVAFGTAPAAGSVTGAAVGAATAVATGAPTGGVTATANQSPNVHSSIGISSPIVGTLSRGEQVEVTGRSADNVWLQIRFVRAPNGLGWVSADLMTLSGPLDSIRIVPQP